VGDEWMGNPELLTASVVIRCRLTVTMTN